ncbi:MAG: hypothetical protein QXS21_03305 [Thermoproteota archaeon]|nr:hypothetical protein [Candidatus Brockarchaeota archaeon]MBO3762990.1 hypothetical protein [Candidatus Brockarchaeota archaeon]MBO3768184.1 hypothetical protein [Candidatus Brockarchaeota archaeon]MBO3800815.1 hypothetical protein [Candidatus Brockarchaeota archaeon]
MVKKYKRRYVVLKLNFKCDDFGNNLKAEIIRVLNKVTSIEAQKEVHPLILKSKSDEDIVVVRVPHTSLMQFKKAVASELPFLKIIFVTGTLKSVKERMRLQKDDLKTM